MTSKSINNKMKLDLVFQTIKREKLGSAVTEFGVLNWSVSIIHIVINLLLGLAIEKELKLVIIFISGKRPHFIVANYSQAVK